MVTPDPALRLRGTGVGGVIIPGVGVAPRRCSTNVRLVGHQSKRIVRVGIMEVPEFLPPIGKSIDKHKASDIKYEERVEGLKIDLNEKKRGTVRNLKNIQIYNYSSNKSIYPKSSNTTFVLKKDDELGIMKRSLGSSVDLGGCGKRVKTKVDTQKLKVCPTSKTVTHENSGSILFK
ncbi:hypothetical protein Tco_1313862 [Tanacetum coccineum]